MRGWITLLLAVTLVVPVLPTTLGDAGEIATPTGIEAPQAPTEQDPAEPLEDRLEFGLLDKLEEGPQGVILHLSDEASKERLLAGQGEVALDRLDGFDVRYVFENIPAVYGLAADVATVRALASTGALDFVEDAHKPIDFLLDTATTATRAKDVWEPDHDSSLGEITDPSGATIDGSGVGIAIVDTGIDATHPDLANNLGANHQVTPAGVVEAGPYTERASTHGTAVAGVAAGDGTASNGANRGAAPGATLYGFSTVFATSATSSSFPEGVSVAPAIAFDWILSNGPDQNPPIRVVSNSWYCVAIPCQTLDQDLAHIELASQLAENDIVVTWAAGDFDSPDRGHDVVSEALNPTPGILGVASYDDHNLGIRTACQAGISAEGNPNDPTTWPDIAAPGSQIDTTAAIHPSDATRVPEARHTYTRLSGTSLAAPHVAGAAALLFQANPGLSAEEVEYLLKASAKKLDHVPCETTYVRADPSHTYDGANWLVGHGLLDAYAAVEQASSTFDGIPEPAPDAEPLPTDIEPSQGTGVDVTERLYLAGGGTFAPDRPTGDDGGQTVFAPGEAAVFRTATLDEAIEIGGIDASFWISTLIENPQYSATNDGGLGPGGGGFLVTLERIDQSGTTVLASELEEYRRTPPGVPASLEIMEVFDEPVQVGAGERLQLTIEVIGVTADDAVSPGLLSSWVLHYGSADHPSHLGIGEAAPAPQGSYEDCRRQAPNWCAWLDADFPAPQWRCEASGVFQLTWYGPPGSSATLYCKEASAICEIPEDADGWQTCKATTQRLSGSARIGTMCTYDVPDGTPPLYHGRCLNLDDR